MEEKGLYKNDNGNLAWAANKIEYPDGTTINVLEHMDKEEGTDVYDGWRVFYTREAALNYFGLEDNSPELNDMLYNPI